MIQCLKRSIANGRKELVASGELKKPDPLKVILKRIILTGYPLKVMTYKGICPLNLVF